MEETDYSETLGQYAKGLAGILTGDSCRFESLFWEVNEFRDMWEFEQSTVTSTMPFGGREKVILWEGGNGQLRRFAAGLRERLHDADRRGNEAWGRTGIAVSQMGSYPATRYTGDKFDPNVAVILPKQDDYVPAIWVFCNSEEFRIEIRRISQRLNVTNATLVKVPFELARWQRIARELFPNGLPKPSSNDLTQWLFNGHPEGAQQPLHVAIARLLGYHWPRQTGSSFMDCPTLGPDGLEKRADADGIVCLTSLQGERPAADRLRVLLSDAFGSEWSAAKLNEMLAQVGYGGQTLEEWLRDGFFQQHCELFQQRPFTWHIWDGLRDGFHAFLNYHKLAAPNGVGRQTLQKLTYSYLGDWIERQRADQKNGVDGADGRLAAALHLKRELEKILEGEPPYDIFVRWKPLHEQPLGWEPDINDGVRINIRPFMMAGTIKGTKNGCILRATPKIKWEKDRGKEPHRPKEDFPWFWKWDGKTENFSGGHEFDGNRWNDLHYSLEKKHEARRRHAAGKHSKKTQEAGR